MMEFSAEQIQKARNDIAMRGILYPYRNEVDLQCQLNAAVELLQNFKGVRDGHGNYRDEEISAFEGGKDEQ